MHNLIESGSFPDVEKIRQNYKEKTGYELPGVATVFRDIRVLREEFRAPLEFDTQKNGYYFFDKNWEFALNTISEKEVFYLTSAKTLLSHFADTPIYNEISQIIDFVTNTQMGEKPNLLNRIAIPPAPKVVIDQKNWDIIMKALKDNEILEFDYNGRWKTNTTHRKIRPYQILLNDGMYFLFGWDENASNNKESQPAGAERLFCINRIKNLTGTGENFKLPECYDFTSRCSGGKFGAFIGERTTQYEIEFYGSSRQLLKDCIWADDQEVTDIDENTTKIKFSSSQSLKIMEWVLAQGMKAKPLAPESFVNSWKSEIRGMMENAGL